MLSKALHPQDVRAFVLPVLYGAKNQVQNFEVLRHYTSGKPFLSSVFSSVSDPKPQQLHTVYTPSEIDAKKPT